MKFSILTAFLLGIFSLINTQGNLYSQTKNAIILENKNTNQVAIIALHLIKEHKRYTAIVRSINIVNTSKKFSNHIGAENWQKDDFIIFILNADKKYMDTVALKQPLHPRYEYPAGNGKIGATRVQLSETARLLRFPFNDQTKYLRITRIGEDMQMHTIATLKLPKNK